MNAMGFLFFPSSTKVTEIELENELKPSETLDQVEDLVEGYKEVKDLDKEELREVELAPCGHYKKDEELDRGMFLTGELNLV
uniref:Uncharacterized protein n=1 Tax=Lutzomyia longipalpis TaxID=7200 RepID=A0A1B0CVE0_LUTLO